MKEYNAFSFVLCLLQTAVHNTSSRTLFLRQFALILVFEDTSEQVRLLVSKPIMLSAQKTRRYTRVGLPKGMIVAWEHSGNRELSRVSVLALGGIFIATRNPPPVGDMIRLFFEVPGGEVRGRAVVRDSQHGKGMGVEFTAMGQDARARLNQLMKVLARV